jgi:hypothetical protein
MMTAPLSRVLGFLNKKTSARLAGLTDGGPEMAAPMMFESLEGRQMMSTIVFTPGHNQTVTNANGNVVVFSLTGKGQGELTVSDKGVFESVKLSATTAASALNVTVTGKADSGTVKIGAIQVAAGAMSAINAGKMDLEGALTVDATITTVTLNNVTGGTLSLFKGNTVAGPTLKLGNVTDTSLNVTGVLAGLEVNSWLDMGGEDDTIKAVAIGRVVSRGDFDANMLLTTNPTATQPTLGSVSVVGEVEGAKWSMTGAMGAVSVGSAVGLTIEASKIASLAATKSGFIETVVTAGQLGSFVSRGNVDLVNLRINMDGTPSPVNFVAIGGISIVGNANHLSISSKDANSNIGAINVSGNISNFHGVMTGNLTSLAATNVDGMVIDAGSIGSLGIRGSGKDFSITTSKISAFTVLGDLTGADLAFDSTASKVFQAMGALRVVGTTSNLDIDSVNAFGNFGSLTLVNSLDSGNWVIGGNVALISTNGTLGNLIYTGKTVTTITVGSLNTVAMDLLSVGTFKASFVVTHFDLTLNTGWPAQTAAFRALGSFTSTGKADHLTIIAAGANSNFGAFTFTQGVSDASIKLNGNGSTFTSPGITSVTLEAGKMTTVTLKGDVIDSSFKNTALTSVAVTGNVSGLTLNLNAAGAVSKANSALATVTISGSADQLNIIGSGANSNVGSVTVTGEVTDSKFNINGNMTKLTAKGFDEDTVGSIAGTMGTFNTTGILSMFDGTYTIGGGITKLSSAAAFSASVAAGGNIGPVTINTTMNMGVIRTTGSIGAVNIGFMQDSTILSGFRADAELPVGLPTSSADFINPLATIGTITIKIIGFPPAPSFIRSVIAGARLGLVSLKKVSTEGLIGGDATFGIAASKSINNVIGVGLPPLLNLSGTGVKYQDGKFVVKIV